MPVAVPEAKPPMRSASSHSWEEIGGVVMICCGICSNRREEALFFVLCRCVIAVWKCEPPYVGCHVSLTASFKAGIKRHAAVHENARAVDVIGIVAGEPHSGAADVVRLADALVGN